MFKKKVSNGVFYVVISLALIIGVSSIAVAVYEAPVAQKVVIVEGDYIEAPSDNEVVDDETAGAFPGPEVYSRMFFRDGFYTSVNLINFQITATSSVDETLPMGTFCNTALETLYLSNWAWSITSSTINFGTGDLTIGTTTCLNGTQRGRCSYLTNSSTATIVDSTDLASTTVARFDLRGYDDVQYLSSFDEGANIATSGIGSWYSDRGPLTLVVTDAQVWSTSTPIALKTGECVHASFGSDGAGATSSDALLTGGGQDLAGVFSGDVTYK